MKRQSECINPLAPLNKRQWRDLIRKIVASYPNNTPIDDINSLVVMQLLRNHPEAEEKIGCGVEELFIRDALYGSRCFWLRRIDGSATDWSWTACLRPSRPIDNFRSALRDAVDYQVQEFRVSYFAQGHPRCAITGKPIGDALAHVHHADPTFAKIVDEFCANNGVDVEAIRFDKSDGQMRSVLAPEHQWMLSAFAEYHARAVLQVVGAKAHLRLPRKNKTPAGG